MRGACAPSAALHASARPRCAAAALRRAAAAVPLPPHASRCCRLRARASPEGRSEAGTPFFVRALARFAAFHPPRSQALDAAPERPAPQGLPDGHLWFRDREEAAAAQAEVVKALSAGGFTPFATALAGDDAAAVVWSRRPNDGEDVPAPADGAVDGDIAADLGAADDAPPLADVSVVSLEDLPPKERAAVEKAYRHFMASAANAAPQQQAAQEARRADDKRSRRARRRQKETLYVRDLLCFVDGDALQHADSLVKVQDAFRDAMRWHLGRALSARSCAALGLNEELAQLVGSFLFAGPLAEVLGHAERLQAVGSRYLGDSDEEEEEQEEAEEEENKASDQSEEDPSDAAERAELLRMEREGVPDDQISPEARAALEAAEAEEEEEEEEDDEAAVAEAVAQAQAMLEQEPHKAAEEVDLSGFYPESVAILARLTFLNKRHADADALTEAAMAGGFRPQVANFMSRRESQRRRRDGVPLPERFRVKPTREMVDAVRDALRRGREQSQADAEERSKNVRSA